MQFMRNITNKAILICLIIVNVSFANLTNFTKDLANSSSYDLGDLQIKFVDNAIMLGANNEYFKGNFTFNTF